MCGKRYMSFDSVGEMQFEGTKKKNKKKGSTAIAFMLLLMCLAASMTEVARDALAWQWASSECDGR